MTLNSKDVEGSAAVVLLSGGLDSSVLLHHVAQELRWDPIHTLSVDYGQRHRRELEAARWQSEAAGAVRHHVLELGFVAALVQDGTSLVSGGAEVPDLAALTEDELDQPPTYVPNRNMMLLSAAAAYAEAQGMRAVFYGAQAQDDYGYWDCTAEFVERLNGVFELNRRDAVTIHAPFTGTKKAELVSMGERLGVDFAHTWSCYRGGGVACGTCPTCVERLKAFGAAGSTDPLSYG